MAAAVVLASGCTPGPTLPDYVAPALDPSRAAHLSTHSGVYVEVVDGAKVDAGIEFGNFGGNELTLTPGKHQLTLSINQTNQYTSQAKESVACTFEAGHAYEIKSRGMFKRGYVLVDTTTGRQERL